MKQIDLLNEIDTREYVSVLRQLTEEGHQVGMTIVGTSMEPFLKDKRDEIFFQKPNRELILGDMVFYQRLDGQYVMHRICQKSKNGYFMAGDHQTILEGPIQEQQIFALITEAKRKGKLITEKHFIWKYYALVWRHLFPVRGVFFKSGSALGKIKRMLTEQR